MSQVQVKLAPKKVREELLFGQRFISHVRSNLDRYTTLPCMNVSMSGNAAAEELFDLTNNPCREDERMRVYGNGRSVSVGDIICVDGVDYLCMSIGWEILQ